MSKFDSIKYQKEVEGYQRQQQNRAKKFEMVFGETSRNVRKKNGVIKTALSILGNPGKYLEDINRSFKNASRKYK